MKKLLAILIIIILMGTVCYASEPNYTDGVMLIANSQDAVVGYARYYGLIDLLEATDGTIIKDGTAYAPLNIFPYLYSRKEIVTCEDSVYTTKIFNRELTIDLASSTAVFDGKIKKVKCFEKDGTLYVPVRWFGERVLDLAVVWKDGKILICDKSLSEKNVEYTFEKYTQYAEKYSLLLGWPPGVYSKLTSDDGYENYAKRDVGPSKNEWINGWIAYASIIINDGYTTAVDRNSHSIGFLDSSFNFTKAVDISMGYYDITALEPPRCGWAMVGRENNLHGVAWEAGMYAPVKGSHFVDTNGDKMILGFEEIIDPGFEQYEPIRALDEFSDGMALMTSAEYSSKFDYMDVHYDYSEKNLKRYIYFINTDGELTAAINSDKYDCSSKMYDCEIDDMGLTFGESKFSNGLLPVREKATGKYGYVNKLGEQVIECRFDSADNFELGIANVELNGHKYWLDTQGNLSEPRL